MKLDFIPPKQECWFAVYSHRFESDNYINSLMRFVSKEALLKSQKDSIYWKVAYLVHVKLK